MNHTDKLLLTVMWTIMTLTGCGPRNHNKQLSIAGFEAQVAFFEQSSVQAGIPYTVDDLVVVTTPNLYNGSNKTDAVTHWGNNQTPRIEIDQDYWNTVSNQGADDPVFFHEMGHAIMHRNHRVDMDTQRQPTSVMWPYGREFDNGYSYALDWYQNRNYYVQEMFHLDPNGSYQQ